MPPEELEAEEELRRSRADVVAAGDADRRRIERDLHDGPQQRLVALAMELQRARLLARDFDSPAELAELLERLAEDVRAALAELRELAARIHPPLLVGHGLAASLRAAVAPAVVETEGKPLGSLPESVAVAIYLSCLEAVESAVAHSGGDVQVRVVLRRDENGVQFTVADGSGFDAAAAPGALLARIADRLGALGGRSEVESTPGRGTLLTARIPLEQ
jgi:signal transduction histidine kinase